MYFSFSNFVLFFFGIIEVPSSNIDFWKKKISNNKSRDDKNSDLLIKLGWKVIIIWQCEISKIDDRIKILNKLLEYIKQ